MSNFWGAYQFVNEYFSNNKDEIAKCYSDYFDCPIKYGKNDDDHAGEQFYHYPVRSFISHFIKNKGDAPEPELVWMANYPTFHEQLQWYKGILKDGAEKWGEFFNHCNKVKATLHDSDAVLFKDGIYLQATLHYTGAKGALIFCEGLQKALNGDYLKAYMRFSESLETFKIGFEGMKSAEHGIWKGFYKNECLDNVSLTIDFLDIARKYVRMLGDDSLFLDWEKTYIWPDSEKRILLETTVTKARCDDELYRSLKEKGI